MEHIEFMVANHYLQLFGCRVPATKIQLGVKLTNASARAPSRDRP